MAYDEVLCTLLISSVEDEQPRRDVDDELLQSISCCLYGDVHQQI